MLSAVRKRMTWANVAMTLALVFAMTGGAYAAKKYLITSTKQISPKVLKSLQGKPGPAGVAGAQGPAGVAGPAGKDGNNGAPGEKGANGESVAMAAAKVGKKAGECEPSGVTLSVGGKTEAICNGKNGQTGFTETLPSGKTEKGDWALTIPKENPGFHLPVGVSALSFVIPLGGTPAAHVTTGGTEECPGSPSNPEAASGQLCVYVEEKLVVEEGHLNVLSSATGAHILDLADPEGAIAYGTWAVTG